GQLSPAWPPAPSRSWSPAARRPSSHVCGGSASRPFDLVRRGQRSVKTPAVQPSLAVSIDERLALGVVLVRAQRPGPEAAGDELQRGDGLIDADDRPKVGRLWDAIERSGSRS